MVLERLKEEVNDFTKPYRVKEEGTTKCRIRLEERMGEVTVFKYSGTILCKHGNMEGEVRKRATINHQQIKMIPVMMVMINDDSIANSYNDGDNHGNSGDGNENIFKQLAHICHHSISQTRVPCHQEEAYLTSLPAGDHIHHWRLLPLL